MFFPKDQRTLAIDRRLRQIDGYDARYLFYSSIPDAGGLSLARPASSKDDADQKNFARLTQLFEEVVVVWPQVKNIRLVDFNHRRISLIEAMIETIFPVVFQFLLDNIPWVQFTRRSHQNILNDLFGYNPVELPKAQAITPKVYTADDMKREPGVLNITGRGLAPSATSQSFASTNAWFNPVTGKQIVSEISLYDHPDITYEYGFNKEAVGGGTESSLGKMEPNIFVVIAHEVFHLAGLVHIFGDVWDIMAPGHLFGANQPQIPKISKEWIRDLYVLPNE